MISQRALLACSVTLRAAPLATEAQQAGKVYRVGILSPGGVPDPSIETSPTLVPITLRELGSVIGENLVVERRFADGRIEQFPKLARELVQLHVEVILGVGDEAVQAAKEATATIPIVMVVASDPVTRGWVANLARPSGNITGRPRPAQPVFPANR